MAKTLVVGIAYPHELASGIGHVACTLGGVNYESRGSLGIIKGSRARGASDPLFRHRFYLVLADGQAARAKRYADAHQGEPYVWGGVPGRGGDCSGYVSGIICTALGRPVARLFGTGTWTAVYKTLGFKAGSGPTAGDAADEDDDMLRYDTAGNDRNDVRELQGEINMLAKRRAWKGFTPLTVDGDYGPSTRDAVAKAKDELGYRGGGNTASAFFAARLSIDARPRFAIDQLHKRIAALEQLHPGGEHVGEVPADPPAGFGIPDGYELKEALVLVAASDAG